MPAPSVSIGGLTLAGDLPFVLIAGPCVIESRAHALTMATALARIARAAGVGLIYKSSFDKANRTSGGSFRGLGLAAGLAVLAEVRARVGCPTLTDVHEPGQCAFAATACNVLQIPALLCRQTDLITAAARTGAALLVKKGQFLAPWDMRGVVEKARAAGCERLLLCERGTSFGYNTLVNDFRALPQLAALDCPVVFDVTHSVQQPGALGSASGGERAFVPVLARAALAVGCAALFAEVHEQPERAPSDGACMLRLSDLPALLEHLKALDALAKGLN